jgi:hypothetical protein
MLLIECSGTEATVRLTKTDATLIYNALRNFEAHGVEKIERDWAKGVREAFEAVVDALAK